MNYTELLRQCVAYFSFAVASIFVLSLVGFLLRRQLRVLLDRWRALGRLGQCVTLVFVSGFVLYGGSKHHPPSPPSDDDPLFSPESMAILLRSMEQGISTPQHSPLTDQSLCASASLRDPITITQSRRAAEASGIQSSTLPHWAARGAWVDWQRIEFPDGFAFPIGTNQITEVTLMSYGALIPASSFQLLASRSEPSSSQPAHQPSTTQPTTINQQPSTNQPTNQPTNQLLISLPSPVSLEPGESSIHYGLTPSNSFLIAWENACVERSATNRVDASIELFRNGDTLVTVQPINQSTNSPTHQPTHQPTTIFTPAALPEGWVGEGQDAA